MAIQNYTPQDSPGKLSANLIGQTFNLLTVVRYVGVTPRGNSVWECKCACGNTTTTISAYLKNNQTKSCGCIIGHHSHHFSTHKATKTHEYQIFIDAKRRCQVPHHHAYASYGGRGIEFRFESFQAFIDHLGWRPSQDYSLDRIDNNGHYEPGNVRWATKTQQMRNRRNTRFLTAFGETKPLEDWGENCAVITPTLRSRLIQGWCVECALTLPKYQGCPHR